MSDEIERVRRRLMSDDAGNITDIFPDEKTAVLNALLAAKWQPIETAPKGEGDEILAACIFDDGSCQQAVAQWWVSCWASLGDREMLPLKPQPKYWQPLPTPPEA